MIATPEGAIVIGVPAAVSAAAVAKLVPSPAPAQRQAGHDMAHSSVDMGATSITHALVALRSRAHWAGYSIAGVPLGPRGGNHFVILGRYAPAGHTGPRSLLGTWAGTNLWKLWLCRNVVNSPTWIPLRRVLIQHPDILELAGEPERPERR